MYRIGNFKYRRDQLSVFLTVFGLAVLVAFAFWLRWRYVRDLTLFIDEFTTLWASQRTLETGAPIMPSGVLYTRGLLSTYIIAAFAAVDGLSYTVGRLPSVLFGLASVLAIFYIGHREWNRHVGWLAAVGLVMLPEAIEASGRARFYSPLLFFVLLTIWAAYVAIQSEKNAKSGAGTSWAGHLFFALCFVLALFSHEETILVYPSILLAMILWRGWRILIQPSVLTAQLICVAAMAVRYAIEVIGQPGYFETMQSNKSYISLSFNTFVAWSEYSRLFIPVKRLWWSLFLLLAVIVALIYLRRVGWRLLQLPRFHQATLFFGIQFFFLLLVLLTVASGWHTPRYMLIAQPFWLLLGAAGAAWVVDRLPVQFRWFATGGVACLIVLSMWSHTFRIIRDQPDNYHKVLDYAATHKQPGDVIMSPQPPACALVLGEPCDYYARQRGYEPYVIERDGVLVDRWSGAKLLSTAEQLEALIQEVPRVWLVSDGQRLGRRYRSDFIRTVVEQFDTVFEDRRVKVLLAEGWRTQPNYTVKKSFEQPVPFDRLALAGWERNDAVPGEYLHVMLFWKQTDAIHGQINTSLQLVGADNSRLFQVDGPPARSILSTKDRPEVLFPDLKSLILPADLAPGRYRLEVIAYNITTKTDLANPLAIEWFRVGPPLAAPAQEVGTPWQNGITLVGHDGLPMALSAAQSFSVRLVWVASAVVDADYTVFMHLINPNGELIAQSDQVPESGFYPTSSWALNDLVEDTYTLQLPANLPTGKYRLLVGWYRPETGQRLPLSNSSDVLELGQWIVE